MTVGEEKSTPSKPRVLIVDDTPSNSKMLRVLLTRQGLICDEATNGAIAVEMVRKSIREGRLGGALGEPHVGYSLVFMDCNMPIMNGLTATRIIRTTLHFGSIIVGCTGNANDTEVEEFIEAGADFVMPKPLRIADLDRLIEYAEGVEYASLPNTQLQLTSSPEVSRKATARSDGPSAKAPASSGGQGQLRLKVVPRARGECK